MKRRDLLEGKNLELYLLQRNVLPVISSNFEAGLTFSDGKKRFPLLHKKKNISGFTLIEMINVILIIGIIAVIAIAKFINFRDMAKAARDQGVLSALRSAVYIYYVRSAASGEPGYPPDLETLKSLIRWDPPELADEYEWEYDPESGVVNP